MADATKAQGPRRVNVFGLLMALLFLVVALVGITGSFWWVFAAATKWALAGLVAVVGIGLVVSALPRGRSARR